MGVAFQFTEGNDLKLLIAEPVEQEPKLFDGERSELRVGLGTDRFG